MSSYKLKNKPPCFCFLQVQIALLYTMLLFSADSRFTIAYFSFFFCSFYVFVSTDKCISYSLAIPFIPVFSSVKILSLIFKSQLIRACINFQPFPTRMSITSSDLSLILWYLVQYNLFYLNVFPQICFT